MPKTRECQRCHKKRILSQFSPRGTVCKPCQKTGAYNRAKDVRLRETYGIDLDEYHQILAMQNGRCAICAGKRSVYDVDHSHSAERAYLESGLDAPQAARLSVRGLLCRRCNRRLLTAATDNPDTLRAAATYLEQPPAHLVLK